jgi:hypothetical protein
VRAEFGTANLKPHCFLRNYKPEKTMKKVLLGLALSMLAATCALAQDNRDQAFGKHDMGPSPDWNMDRNNTGSGTQGMATRKPAERGMVKHSKKADRKE